VSVTLLIGGLVIPAAVLLVDLGRRRLTRMRILRPFLGAIIVPFVMPGFDLHGTGLLLEVASCAAGILLGLLAATAMRVERDEKLGSVVTVAGAPYAAIWLVVAAGRLLFTYETEHSASFGRAVGTFLVSNHISVTALADSFMFIGFAMLLAHRGTLFFRGRQAAAHTPTEPVVHSLGAA